MVSGWSTCSIQISTHTHTHIHAENQVSVEACHEGNLLILHSTTTLVANGVFLFNKHTAD